MFLQHSFYGEKSLEETLGVVHSLNTDRNEQGQPQPEQARRRILGFPMRQAQPDSRN